MLYFSMQKNVNYYDWIQPWFGTLKGQIPEKMYSFGPTIGIKTSEAKLQILRLI